MHSVASLDSMTDQTPTSTPVDPAAVAAALDSVCDPEIGKPLPELGMIKGLEIGPQGQVTVQVWLTVAGCPLKERITTEVSAAVGAVPGVSHVRVELDVMSQQQRTQLQTRLRGHEAREIPFAQPGNRTRVFAIASGKGGVGKSSITANLAAAMAAQGFRVGVADADIYGFSIPRMLGVTGAPTKVEAMIMPPEAHGVKVISMGMFVPDNGPVLWRGPMLHRALEQFLADVYWGELDVLLLDLPPGTGDVAISLAQLVPGAQIVVVTTPQQAAAEVAQRAGALAGQTQQRVAGVIENMAWLPCPHCPAEGNGSPSHRLEIFGSGGGSSVAQGLAHLTRAEVPVLAQIPLDPALREGSDTGLPLVLAHPDSPAALALHQAAAALAGQRPSLVGRPLTLTPA